MKSVEISNFGGVVCGVDPRLIQIGDSQECVNVFVEDGDLIFRRGFRNIRAAQVAFTANWGFEYLQGYNASNALTEEYMSFEALGGNVKPYKRDVTTMVPTEVTNAGAALNLNASDWKGFVFNGTGYLYNPNNTPSVFRHTLGTTNVFLPLSIPTAPATVLTYTILYGGSSTPYVQLSWLGLDPTSAVEMACTGTATNTGSSLLADNSIAIRHTNGAPRDCTVTMDFSLMTAGVQDFDDNDCFAFPLSCKTSSFQIDPATVGVSFINNDGSPVTLVPSSVQCNPSSQVVPGAVGSSYAVRFEFYDKDRTLFDNVRKCVLSYRVLASSSTVANNDLYVGKIYIGGVTVLPLTPPVRDPFWGMSFGYSYYWSANDFESGTGGLLFVPNQALRGSAPLSAVAELGVHVRFTMVASADANVDQFRFYVSDGVVGYRRAGTQSDATLTYDYKITFAEVLRLPLYTPSPFRTTGVVGAIPYKGFVAWLCTGGYQNVLLSRVGEPERQESANDDEADLGAGNTLTLAANAGDEPLGGVDGGSALIVGGANGVYASVGNIPIDMSPFKRVPGSFGVAGKFAMARWQDDAGNPGMAYLSREAQVYFVLIDPSFNGDDGSRVIELSAAIRTGSSSIRTYLMDGQAITDISLARVFVDEAQDCLVVALGKKALCIRRQSLVSGNRRWEPYNYTSAATTVMQYVAASTRRRVRFIDSAGKTHEWEWNSATNAYIEGTLRDGGSAAPAAHWVSSILVGNNVRLNYVHVYRQTLTNTPTVTGYCSRDAFAGTAKTLTTGLRYVRFGPSQSGTEHYFKLAITEGDGKYNRVKLDFLAAGDRRNA